MVRKIAQYRIQGMNRDISESVSNADKSENLFKYAYEIMNMRVLTNTEDNTTFSLVNEKGTSRVQIKQSEDDHSVPSLQGTIIGAVPFNDKIVIFLTSTQTGIDTIAVLDCNYIVDSPSYNRVVLENIIYTGHLNFDIKHPIEAITCYENDSIQKVYWTDGLNSPRMINICDTYSYSGNDVDHQFDFTPQMTLNEQVTIEKLTSEDTATFPAGTIQYVLTYSNRYAQETNPFYISPLYYNIKNHTNNSELDRGGKVDEICTKPFKIHIENIDQTFDLIHIYSIQTTEQNNRLVKRVVTLNNVNSLSAIDFYDTGRTGEILDINEVAFLNEKWSLVVQTINHKDNRLFAGNVETTNPKVKDSIKNNFKTLPINYYWDSRGGIERKINLRVTDTDYYPYKTQLDMNSFQMKTFKSNETYRFGVQLQDDTGKWSEVIFINDKKNPLYPHYIFHNDAVKNIDYYYTYAHTSITATFGGELMAEGFVKIRPVVVFPSWTERETACQGLLCPTVYSTGGRMENAPYAQSSWFTRPNAPIKILSPQSIPGEGHYSNETDNTESAMPWLIDNTYQQEYYNEYSNYISENEEDIDLGFIAEFRHNTPIPSSDNRNGELYCNDVKNTLPSPYDTDAPLHIEARDKTKSNFYIDQSLITLHSPELEFDTNLQSYDLNSLKFRIIGVINWTSNKADIQLQAGSSPNNPPYSLHMGSVTTGIKKNIIGVPSINTNGYKTLISGPFWFDYSYYPRYTSCNGNGVFGHIVYPFHKRCLNNWDWYDPEAHTSIEDDNYTYTLVPLNEKIIYNAKYAIGNNYYNVGSILSMGDCKLFNGNNLLLNAPNNSGINDSIVYYGNFSRTIQAPNFWTTNYHTPESSGNTGHHTILGVEHHFASKTEKNYPGIVTYPSDNSIYYDSDDNFGTNKYAYAGFGINVQFGPFKHKWGFLKHWNRIDTGLEHPENAYSSANLGLTPWLCPSSRASINMNYKSTNHAVIVLNSMPHYDSEDIFTSSSQICLPTINGLNTPDGVDNEHESYDPDTHTYSTWHYGSGYPNAFYGFIPSNILRQFPLGTYYGEPFWNRAAYATQSQHFNETFIQDNLRDWRCQLINAYNLDNPNYSNIKCGWSLIGELYREQNPYTLFGGNSESAIESNIWYIAGESIRLDDIDSNYRINIYWTEGDTYFQRYDHLKTYSPANVQNGIVDVASFMVETRINLDGRCDINRGRNYFGVNNTNFNLMNMAYTQDNNMFTGHTSDSNWLDLDRYPNQVIWSTVKNYGEKIDSWCNLSLITALDFDGNRGVIRKIERFANELIVFQDNAISKINYNQNVQIATSTGTPIQIANSNAIEGKVYLTTSIGTRNKWSIVNTPTGIYFIDYSNIGIYKFNGQGVPVNLTDNFGFRSFMIKDLRKNFLDAFNWNPLTFGDPSYSSYGDFVGYYDFVNGDVFYINKQDCITFNDKLNIFTSFYSYNNTPYFVNVNNLGIFFRTSEERTTIWLEHDGDYNIFFDNDFNHYITFIANPNSHTDKIYDTLEFRSDMFDNNDNYLSDDTFDYIRVWNEYQDTKLVPLNLRGGINSYGEDINIPSNLKKKFRTWRVQIPRDTKDEEHKRNRIRNPWAYIKLEKNKPKCKHVVHDIIVGYFE